MTEYKPDLPEGMSLPAGASINVLHQDYKALETIAREEGWSQKAFSRTLGLEVARSERARAAAPAAPAPAPAPAVDVSKLSTREAFAYALAHGSTPSYRGQR
jgi:hypothetical protein